jgi:hypothetical protein
VTSNYYPRNTVATEPSYSPQETTPRPTTPVTRRGLVPGAPG